METEKLKLTQVSTNAANPRTITEKQFEKLVLSILVFPEMLEARPIVVDDTNTALGGNMRYRALTAIASKDEAAIRESLEKSGTYTDKTEGEREALMDRWRAWLADPTITVVRASQFTEEQKKEFIIKDNVGYGEWDMELLQDDVQWDNRLLQEWGLDDFEEQGEEPDAQEDGYTDEDADKAPTRCHEGDIWLLGRHRLMCGDSTKEADVARLMGGRQADLLLTDPPYNVNYEGGTKEKMTIANDNMEDAAFVAFLLDAFTNADKAMKPGAAFYIWHADSKGWEFRSALKDAGFTLRETLIWVKNSLVLGRQDYQWQHEPCLYGWKDGAAHFFTDDRSQATVFEDAGIDYKKLKKDELLQIVLKLTDPNTPSTVLYEDKPTHNDIHPTMKPVRLMARLMKNSSRQEELVLDLFGGSGSTLIAAEQTKRTCYTMEFDPKYCDAILDRWEKLTGEEAECIYSKTDTGEEDGDHE